MSARRRIYWRPEDLEQERGPCPRLAGTFEERHGISRAEVRAYEERNGVTGTARAYEVQRRNAWERGIAWEMNLREWLELWGEKISLRGQGSGMLMMCRKNDSGPYSKGNVRIATAYENSMDRFERSRVAKWVKWSKNDAI